MTPQLIEALTRLSPLAPHELALVSATASALMAHPVPAAPSPRLPPDLAVPRIERSHPHAPTRKANEAVGLDIPAIGGASLPMAPSPLFVADAFLARWRPGRRVLVYLAGNVGLATLVRRLKSTSPNQRKIVRLCAFKVGTHEVGTDLAVRLDRLSAERYGSLWRDGTTVVADPWGPWVREPIHPGLAEPAAGSPVRVGVDAVEVLLPAAMTPAAFDQQLGKRLSPSTLAAVALSPAGRDLCAAIGETHTRFVRYSPGRAGKLCRATELTLITRHDIGRLVLVIEQLLLDHVMTDTDV